jgi:hypothetical protein
LVIAAVVAASLLGVLALFQLALAFGARAGAAAWGGSHPGVLPTRLRVASGVAGLLFYPALLLLVLDSGGAIEIGGEISTSWLWIITGFFAIGTLLNLVSRSKVERIWGPVSLVIAVCFGVIAAGS